MPESTLDPRRWLALALLCGAFFMIILDAAIVTVALPSIEADLGFSPQGLQWVVSAYALTFAGLLLLGGRAADLLGRRRVFMVGIALFTLASLLCGLAWSDEALIGARAVQARPQSSEAAVKSPSPSMNRRRRPSRSAARPPSSRKPANVSAYALSTHCNPCAENPRSLSIDGSATTTIAESRMTMKNAPQSRASANQRRGSSVDSGTAQPP